MPKKQTTNFSSRNRLDASAESCRFFFRLIASLRPFLVGNLLPPSLLHEEKSAISSLLMRHTAVMNVGLLINVFVTLLQPCHQEPQWPPLTRANARSGRPCLPTFHMTWSAAKCCHVL